MTAEKISELLKEKKVDGITYIGDESNREGMRINIELRRDVKSELALCEELYCATVPISAISAALRARRVICT